MTTTAFASAGAPGVRRAVGEDLHALADILPDAEWPPWADCRVNALVGRIRRRIDEQLDRDGREVGDVASRLGLELEELRRSASEHKTVRRWVSVLAGPPIGDKSVDIIAELLIVDLFADELAYIGMLARAVGPAERVAATT